MNRYLAKSFVLLLLLAPLSGATWLGAKQPVSPKLEALAGATYHRLSPASLEQDELNSSGLQEYTTRGHVLGFQEDGVVIASGRNALSVKFVGARPARPLEEEPFASVEGSGSTRPLGRVIYRDLWAGVSVFYEKSEFGISKSTYYVQPGAAGAFNPVHQIQLRYNVPAKVDMNGELVLSFASGEMRETKPEAWQEIGGKRHAVDVEFCLLGGQDVGFKVGAYDARHLLVIDPILRWHTFLGGSDFDKGMGIAIDSYGNVYVTGISDGTWGEPVRPHAGGSNAFVAKLDINGVLIWNTFLGTVGSTDPGAGITTDSDGNIYVTGQSFPTWGSPIRPFTGSVWADAFVAKLDRNGVLQWNTFLGGERRDYGRGLAVDAEGNVYVAGYSFATWGEPLSPYVSSYYGGWVAKLGGDGSLQWNTFMGSDHVSYLTGIVLDAGNNIYVCGACDGGWGTPIKAFTPDTWDGYVAKLDTDGALLWHTFLGQEYSTGIAMDSNGDIVVGGGRDVIWAKKLEANGIERWTSTFGSLLADYGNGVAVDVSGHVYLAGYSPATWGTPDRAYTGGRDAFVLELDGNGVLQWNTFLGEVGNDEGNGIAVDGSGKIYVTGLSAGTWGSPVRAYTQSSDAFVAKFQDIPGLSLISLAPMSATVWDTSFILTVEGSGFTEGATVVWDGEDRQTTFTSSSQVRAEISADDFTVAGTVQIMVRNTDGKTTNAQDFIVNNPVPSLSALEPPSARAGDPGLTLVVTGDGFVDGTVVIWDGADRPTAFISRSEVRATIEPGDLALKKVISVSARNPGSGTSNALEFSINDPLPILTSLVPSTTSAGGQGLVVSVMGSKFQDGATVRWDGSDRPTAFINEYELDATIGAGDISVGGEVQITVANPIPAGSISNALIFPVSGFTVNSSPTSVTVTAGQSAAYAIQVIPQFGSFDSPVALTCTGLPRNATASISPGSVTPGANTATVTLNVATSTNSGSAIGASLGISGAIPPATGLLLTTLIIGGWFGIFKHSPWRLSFRWFAVVALICVIGLVASCSAGGNNNPPNNATPPGTYQLTVQGESGSLKTSAIVTLVVR